MTTPEIDYADVQGTILRGYRVDLARHFILRITDAAAAGTFVGNLVNGTGGVPKITTAQRWRTKPECFVNISFTAPGLAALGVPQEQLRTFDPAFLAGATSDAVASVVGDTGTSAPANWLGGIQTWQDAHVVLSLWVHEDPAVLERVSAQLRAAFAAGMSELLFHDATALPDNHVHFGYRDNIAQPTVQGAPPRKRDIPDDQPVVPTGEFLLGYPNASG
ncbi:MAG: peroxidase, partial [Gemmatimonadetes bacterium]|nr:peroxidase [Gemmatimonadota bacterium]